MARRRVDWIQLLTENRIPFIDRGPNVKRGNINCQCPMCGSADPSMHMGIDPETGWWGCWRNAQHRGKSPLRLFMALLRIPYWKARQLLGLDEDYVDPDGFDAVAARIMGRNKNIERMEQVRRDFLDFPEEFKVIKPTGITARFFDYLADERDFGEAGTRELCRQYDVCCAVRGEQAGRVVLPYFMNAELVAWTGRAIAAATIRYKDLSLEDSLVPIKETLFNYDAMLRPAKWLIVVEGPMDALKIDLFGRKYGVRAVALSTNSISEEQIYELEEAAGNFDQVGVMMDNAGVLGIVDSMRRKQELSGIKNLRSLEVPYGLKDSAQMRPREAADWAAELAEKEVSE